jgi:hypothetical protein
MSDADGAPAPSDEFREPWWVRHLELIAVLLIALTAVFTAWSAFQSSKWGGVMSIRFSEAGAARTESVRNSNLANNETVIDVNLFANWVDALAVDDDELADFYQARFPDRLAVAVDAWLATEPLRSADAPASPFDMDEYRLEPQEEAARLEARAERRSALARDANQTGDNYTVTSVFFASAILLAALSAKIGRLSLRIVMLAGSAVLLLGTAVVVATFPVEI